MSKIALTPNASGTGTLTIAAPNTSTDRTLTLPDETGTVLSSGGAIDVNASAPADSISIDSSGNVGVNNTSPAISPYVNLNVKGGASGGVVTAQSSDSGSSVAIYSGNNSSDHPAILYQKDLRIGSTTGLGTAGYTERMRIDSSGRVTMPYQPYFRAYLTSNTVFNNTPIVYNGVVNNVGNHYNGSTGRFTAPVTGVYSFSFVNLLMSLSNNAGAYEPQMRVNGSNVRLFGRNYYQNLYTGDGGYLAFHGSIEILLSANDIFDIYSVQNVTYHANPSWTNFTGVLIG